MLLANVLRFLCSLCIQSPYPEVKDPLREIENHNATNLSELKMALKFAHVEEASSCSALSSPADAKPTASVGITSSVAMLALQATPIATPSHIGTVDNLVQPSGGTDMVENSGRSINGNLKPTRVMALDKNLSRSVGGPLGKGGRSFHRGNTAGKGMCVWGGGGFLWGREEGVCIAVSFSLCYNYFYVSTIEVPLAYIIFMETVAICCPCPIFSSYI